MKLLLKVSADGTVSRAPYGARGLKPLSAAQTKSGSRRAPYGARGLKRYIAGIVAAKISRAPYGARGLKRPLAGYQYRARKAAPRTGRVG